MAILTSSSAFTLLFYFLILRNHRVVADVPPVTDVELYNSGVLNKAPLQYFHTLNVSLPLFLKTKMDQEQIDASQYIFITPNQEVEFGGPMIYDARTLSPVYADMSFMQVGDLRVQQYNGSDHLVFSSLDRPAGFSHCRIYDSSYRLAFRIEAVGISHELINLHECQLTQDGTALITVDQRIPWDLTRVSGSSKGQIVDSIMQEIDVATGELVFEWRASDHVDITESFSGVGNSTWWDYCHLNSFEKTNEGNFLISMRHIGAVRHVNGTDGSTIWQLGGKRNTFEHIIGRETDFSFQHFARFVDGNTSQLTLFNNNGAKTYTNCESNCSRGMYWELDHQSSTARLLQSYKHPQGIAVGAMGSMQRLPSGNVYINWGTLPSITEYLPNGSNVAEIQWGVMLDHIASSYRAVKMNWTATPEWPPSIVYKQRSGNVYLSWNGATEVCQWAILAAESQKTLEQTQAVARIVEKDGFETAMSIDTVISKRFIRAAALDRNGKVIGSTGILDRSTGDVVVAPTIASVQRCWRTMYSCACVGIS